MLTFEQALQALSSHDVQRRMKIEALEARVAHLEQQLLPPVEDPGVALPGDDPLGDFFESLKTGEPPEIEIDDETYRDELEELYRFLWDRQDDFFTGSIEELDWFSSDHRYFWRAREAVLTELRSDVDTGKVEITFRGFVDELDAATEYEVFRYRVARRFSTVSVRKTLDAGRPLRFHSGDQALATLLRRLREADELVEMEDNLNKGAAS